MNDNQFIVRVEHRFEAAHHLREYHGKPEPLHGHSWKVEVFIQSPKLDPDGMVVDYLVIKKTLTEIIAPFDHGYINDVPPFDVLNPSSENMAAYLFEKLNRIFTSSHASLIKVILWEGPEYYAVCEKKLKSLQSLS